MTVNKSSSSLMQKRGIARGSPLRNEAGLGCAKARFTIQAPQNCAELLKPLLKPRRTAEAAAEGFSSALALIFLDNATSSLPRRTRLGQLHTTPKNETQYMHEYRMHASRGAPSHAGMAESILWLKMQRHRHRLSRALPPAAGTCGELESTWSTRLPRM